MGVFYGWSNYSLLKTAERLDDKLSENEYNLEEWVSCKNLSPFMSRSTLGFPFPQLIGRS
jgi:hypothetical protein